MRKGTNLALGLAALVTITGSSFFAGKNYERDKLEESRSSNGTNATKTITEVHYDINKIPFPYNIRDRRQNGTKQYLSLELELDRINPHELVAAPQELTKYLMGNLPAKQIDAVGIVDFRYADQSQGSMGFHTFQDALRKADRMRGPIAIIITPETKSRIDAGDREALDGLRYFFPVNPRYIVANKKQSKLMQQKDIEGLIDSLGTKFTDKRWSYNPQQFKEMQKD